MFSPSQYLFRPEYAINGHVLPRILLANDYTKFGDLVLNVYSQLYYALPAMKNTRSLTLCSVYMNGHQSGWTEIVEPKNPDSFTLTFGYVKQIPTKLLPDHVLRRDLNVTTFQVDGSVYVRLLIPRTASLEYNLPMMPRSVYTVLGLMFSALIKYSARYRAEPQFVYPYLRTGIADSIFDMPMYTVIKNYPYHIWYLNGEIWKNYSNLLPSADSIPTEVLKWLLQRAVFDRDTPVIESLAQRIKDDIPLQAAFTLGTGWKEDDWKDTMSDFSPLTMSAVEIKSHLLRR